MDVVLISTYELGHQPFGLASPAAWLRRRGHRVRCLDLSREPLDESAVGAAGLVAFYVPMHTATRLAARLVQPIRRLNPRAALCFYGLYAPVNEDGLRGLGVEAILGGEFEQGLADLASRLADSSARQGTRQRAPTTDLDTTPGRGRGDACVAPTTDLDATPGGGRGDGSVAPTTDLETTLGVGKGDACVAPTPARGNGLPRKLQPEPVVSLARQSFAVPDRRGLVPLERYARVVLADGRERIAGYTEASRGCKHRCRHCPIVPVYNGVFRVVQPEIVLEDVRQQVEAGAGHITFGDPDFFNGPRHALEIVRALHAEFPDLSYDVTIKVEHLLARRKDLGVLRDTGCLFVTTAVESFDDAVLARLEKGHTRADVHELVRLFREAGLALHPTFVPFTPWTTLESYGELLDEIDSLDLVENVAPVQLAIRLLVTAGSRLLELEEVRRVVGPYDAAGLAYPWRHPDTRVDRLQREIEAGVQACQGRHLGRAETFAFVRRKASQSLGAKAGNARFTAPPRRARAAIPYLTEPWYC